MAKALSLHVGSISISPSNATCNCGVMMASAWSMSNHISKLCKSASFALWKISRIRKKFQQRTSLKLIDAFVASRMDYCNILLFGLPSREVIKIRIIQNSVARLITKTTKYDHMTHILQGPHWLPVGQRIKSKLICTTYEIIYGAAPAYLNKLVSIYAPPRNWRSNSVGRVRLN